MKESINLLPPAAKHLRIRRFYSDRVGRLLRRGILMLIVFLVVLVSVYILLNQENQRVVEQINRRQNQDTDVSERVIAVNEVVTTIYRHAQENTPIAPQIEDVFAIVPPTVLIRSLDLDEITHTVTIQGISQSRTELLALEQKLKQLPWVERLEAPLQNLATGTGGSFSFMLYRKSIP